MPSKEKPEREATQPSEERMELCYCPRCGTLQVQRASARRKVCGACARLLRWIYGGGES